MGGEDHLDEAIEVLQQLGLREYEARCFVGLSRLSSATAKRLSETADVPRTRVYDAVRVLEARGLVSVHHTSPQEFRAVSLEEAVETLRSQYESRIDRLQGALDPVGSVDPDEESTGQQVWSLSGRDAVENRVGQLGEEATDEVVVLLGSKSLLTEGFVDTLEDVGGRVDLFAGGLTEPVHREVRERVPSATTIDAGLSWLAGEPSGQASVGRIVVVDRSTVLVSSTMPGGEEERAIFGDGPENGLVVLARRVLERGLLADCQTRP